MFNFHFFNCKCKQHKKHKKLKKKSSFYSFKNIHKNLFMYSRIIFASNGSKSIECDLIEFILFNQRNNYYYYKLIRYK